MPFNGSGVFQRVRNWVADATAGVKIRADYHDAEDDGFAAGLTNCIAKDGQSVITQNIPFNSKRITGLADPVNAQDASTKAYADTKMPLAGGVLTGDITIRKDTPQLIMIDLGAAGGNNFSAQKNDKQRWLMRLGNGTAETGANAGTDLDLHRYADDGTYLGQVLNVSRASGDMHVTGNFVIGNGVVYLTDTAHYLQFYNGQYFMPNGKLTLGAQGTTGNDAVTWDQLQTKQSSFGFTPVQQGGGLYQQANKVYIGWDGAALRAQVDGTDLGKMFTEFTVNAGAIIKDARLAYAGDVSIATGPQSSVYEPYSGAVITGWTWAIIGGIAEATLFRLRYMQVLNNSGWYTVGYA